MLHLWWCIMISETVSEFYYIWFSKLYHITSEIPLSYEKCRPPPLSAFREAKLYLILPYRSFSEPVLFACTISSDSTCHRTSRSRRSSRSLSWFFSFLVGRFSVRSRSSLRAHDCCSCRTICQSVPGRISSSRESRPRFPWSFDPKTSNKIPRAFWCWLPFRSRPSSSQTSDRLTLT